MTRVFWLSFAAVDRHLGCCVVDVDDDDAAAARDRLLVTHPRHQPGSEWAAAAMRKAHDMACNPGGSCAAIELAPATLPADLPRNRLLLEPELLARGWSRALGAGP